MTIDNTDNTDNTSTKETKCQKKKGRKCGKSKRDHRHTVTTAMIVICAILLSLSVCLSAAWLFNQHVEDRVAHLQEETVSLRHQLKVVTTGREEFCESGSLRTMRCGDRTDACICGDPTKMNFTGP
jgi:hypothetical protein